MLELFPQVLLKFRENRTHISYKEGVSADFSLSTRPGLSAVSLVEKG
jgi:hypothetical protein